MCKYTPHGGTFRYHPMDITFQNRPEVLFETDEADLTGIVYSKKDKKLLAANWYTDKRKEKYFDDLKDDWGISFARKK